MRTYPPILKNAESLEPGEELKEIGAFV